MSDHLSSAILTGLADGELSPDQLLIAKEHLDTCPACTSTALAEALMKSAVARSGQRYTAPPELQARLKRLTSQRSPRSSKSNVATGDVHGARGWSWSELSGWAVAAVVLVIACGIMLTQWNSRRMNLVAQRAALVAEVSDLHISTLAANQPPEVLSSDRHTVKPWFQGKIPFSFNLPDNLPGDVTLDGANLAYLGNQPVAQLLYSIGRHRVSVFVREKTGGPEIDHSLEHSGFQVVGFNTRDLDVVAVSDVDPTRLSALVHMIEQVQAGGNSK